MPVSLKSRLLSGHRQMPDTAAHPTKESCHVMSCGDSPRRDAIAVPSQSPSVGLRAGTVPQRLTRHARSVCRAGNRPRTVAQLCRYSATSGVVAPSPYGNRMPKLWKRVLQLDSRANRNRDRPRRSSRRSPTYQLRVTGRTGQDPIRQCHLWRVPPSVVDDRTARAHRE